MNDTVAIDVGSAYADLCVWDGRSLYVDKVSSADPLEALPRWIERLGPRPRFDLIARVTRPSKATTDIDRRLVDLGSACGARSTRVVPRDCPADPGMAAARQFADRHRLGTICSIEIGAAEARAAVLDRRGRPIASDVMALSWAPGRARSGGDARTALLAEGVRRVLHEAATCPGARERGDPPVVCFGGAGPPVAAELAAALGLESIHVPVYAGTLACVGLIFADIVLSLREDGPPGLFDLTALRRRFSGLMDEANLAVARHGYDLDDTICERIVELAYQGDADSVQVSADSLADAEPLLSRFREARGSGATVAGGRPIEILGASVRATIEARKPLGPLPIRLRGRPIDAVGGAAPAATDSPRPRGERSRSDMAAGTRVDGPSVIVEPHTRTHVPRGWSARVLATGDLLLSRRVGGS